MEKNLKKQITDSNYWNKKLIDNTRKTLENYDNDTRKESRLDAKLCKCCYYIKSWIGTCDIKTSQCDNCGCDVVNSSGSLLYKLCERCGIELGLCSFCSGDMN